MSSIKLTKEIIDNFLESEENKVLCIKGGWGVGKTYLWNESLEKYIDKDNNKFEKYSYVSLFGLNTIQEVKNKIILEKFSRENHKENNTFKSIKKLFSKLVSSVKILDGYFDPIPFLDYFLKDQIICIDDLERSGENLTPVDIFGFISYLKQEKNCKLILILNDQELVEHKKEIFLKHLEKVVDVDVFLDPFSFESVEYGLDDQTEYFEILKKNIIGLDIKNVRVIKKVDQYAKILWEFISGKNQGIINGGMTTLVISVFCKYLSHQAPNIDFIKKYNRFFNNFDKGEKNKFSEEEKKWNSIMLKTDFAHFDELDEIVNSSVENGFFEKGTFNTYFDSLKDSTINQKVSEEITKCWNKFHNDFNITEEEVFSEFKSVFRENIKNISTGDVDAITSLFLEFNKLKEADVLLNLYLKEIENRDKDFYNIKSFRLNKLRNIKLDEFFNSKHNSFKDDRDPAEVLENIYKNSGWNPEDIKLISGLTKQDFYNLFKSNNNIRQEAIIQQSLKMKTYSQDEEYQLISINAELALKDIANESPINKKRVSRFIYLDNNNKI